MGTIGCTTFVKYPPWIISFILVSLICDKNSAKTDRNIRHSSVYNPHRFTVLLLGLKVPIRNRCFLYHHPLLPLSHHLSICLRSTVQGLCFSSTLTQTPHGCRQRQGGVTGQCTAQTQQSARLPAMSPASQQARGHHHH